MSKPIFPAIRQFMLSALLRVSSPKLSGLSEPEPKLRDLHPENDMWMFDTPRDLAAHKADYGQTMSRLSGQLAGVRELLSRISPTAPVPAEDYGIGRTGAVWSDTVLFDGEPAPIAAWGESTVEDDMDYLFGGADTIENDLIANELFGGYGYVPALIS